MSDLSTPTLCLGIDVTWWGGSPGRPDSQRDTIVYSVVQASTPSDLRFEMVDLSVAPNCNSSSDEPSFDASGDLLVDQVAKIMAEYHGRFQRCVVALDAPLQAKFRKSQPKRVKATAKGKPTGAKRRECEDHIEKHKRDTADEIQRRWHSDLRIQSGSPIAPRIARILDGLRSKCGLTCWGTDRSPHDAQVIEIFPSEAIWSLGVLGGFPTFGSDEVRSYKSKKPRILSRENAAEVARRPLLGFAVCLEALLPQSVRTWSNQIADYACAIAKDRENSANVLKGKGFDDPIDSGLAFLTAVAFVGGVCHVWGDGTDGTIVGPGRLNEVKMA